MSGLPRRSVWITPWRKTFAIIPGFLRNEGAGNEARANTLAPTLAQTLAASGKIPDADANVQIQRADGDIFRSDPDEFQNALMNFSTSPATYRSATDGRDHRWETFVATNRPRYFA
jgi:hypothetical protein